jgi:tRNA nucleotidyltransferase (CCA-adding enzyme)
MRNQICAYVNEVGRAIGVKFYLVGGTVRDEILGVPVNDWDLVATGLSWDELIAAMKPFGRTEATGESFNVIRHFPNVNIGTPYIEVALPRREYSTGPKTTDVDAKYDPHMAIEDDLMRRDYSINSMARDCETGGLIDPFNGVGDLEAGVLRMLHPDSARDDSLRILRGVRFMGRFGFSVTPETDKQLRDNVDLLFAVSGERFQKELLELVTSPHVDVALRYMQSIGALKELFPELEEGVGCTQNEYHDHDVWEHTVRVVTNTPSSDPYVRLGALFHDISKPRVKWTRPDGRTHFYMPEKDDEFAPDGEPQVRGNHEQVGADMAWEIMGQQRLKFSAQHQARVTLFVREHMFSVGKTRRAARRFLARLAGTVGGVEANMEALIDIRIGDLKGGKVRDDLQKELDEAERFRDLCRSEIANESAFSVRDLALNGHDMMELGFTGAEIGTELRRLLDKVLDDPSLNTRDLLLMHTR